MSVVKIYIIYNILDKALSIMFDDILINFATYNKKYIKSIKSIKEGMVIQYIMIDPNINAIQVKLYEPNIEASKLKFEFNNILITSINDVYISFEADKRTELFYNEYGKLIYSRHSILSNFSNTFPISIVDTIIK